MVKGNYQQARALIDNPEARILSRALLSAVCATLI